MERLLQRGGISVAGSGIAEIPAKFYCIGTHIGDERRGGSGAQNAWIGKSCRRRSYHLYGFGNDRRATIGCRHGEGDGVNAGRGKNVGRMRGRAVVVGPGSGIAKVPGPRCDALSGQKRGGVGKGSRRAGTGYICIKTGSYGHRVHANGVTVFRRRIQNLSEQSHPEKSCPTEGVRRIFQSRDVIGPGTRIAEIPTQSAGNEGRRGVGKIGNVAVGRSLYIELNQRVGIAIGGIAATAARKSAAGESTTAAGSAVEKERERIGQCPATVRIRGLHLIHAQHIGGKSGGIGACYRAAVAEPDVRKTGLRFGGVQSGRRIAGAQTCIVGRGERNIRRGQFRHVESGRAGAAEIVGHDELVIPRREIGCGHIGNQLICRVAPLVSSISAAHAHHRRCALAHRCRRCDHRNRAGVYRHGPGNVLAAHVELQRCRTGPMPQNLNRGTVAHLINAARAGRYHRPLVIQLRKGRSCVSSTLILAGICRAGNSNGRQHGSAKTQRRRNATLRTYLPDRQGIRPGSRPLHRHGIAAESSRSDIAGKAPIQRMSRQCAATAVLVSLAGANHIFSVNNGQCRRQIEYPDRYLIQGDTKIRRNRRPGDQTIRTQPEIPGERRRSSSGHGSPDHRAVAGYCLPVTGYVGAVVGASGGIILGTVQAGFHRAGDSKFGAYVHHDGIPAAAFQIAIVIFHGHPLRLCAQQARPLHYYFVRALPTLDIAHARYRPGEFRTFKTGDAVFG